MGSILITMISCARYGLPGNPYHLPRERAVYLAEKLSESEEEIKRSAMKVMNDLRNSTGIEFGSDEIDDIKSASASETFMFLAEHELHKAFLMGSADE